MATQVNCIRCGQPIESGPVLAGGAPTCVECRSGSQARTDAAGWSSPSPSAQGDSLLSFEKAVSRSMLLPLPGIVPSAPGEMICRLEPESLRYLEMSNGLQQLLRLPPGQVVHQSLLQHLHQDDRELAQEEFRQVCEHGERNDLVLRLKAANGSLAFMRIYAQARYEPGGSVNHIRCNFKDVTDRVRADQELNRRTEKLIAANELLRQTNQKLKETQSRLVQSEKLAALGTLAAGMAHEINNPLAFAMNNTAVLKRDISELFEFVEVLQENGGKEPVVSADGPAPRFAELATAFDFAHLRESLPQLIDSTYRGLVRVARIVEQLKAFARLDRTEIGEVNVNESIDQCLLMLGESISRLSIAVERRFALVPPLRAAVAHINQVFLDLLSNGVDAIEAAGRGAGRIEVATQHLDGAILIEISDNGNGISPTDLSRIFDPFFTTKAPGKGTGLGLSVCQRVITEHGGRIELDSNPESGTCFRILLPVDGPF
jgi:two-component system, NtrC family, sensor kinase